MNQVEVKRRQIEVCSYLIALINILLFGTILKDNGITYLVISWEAFSIVWTLAAGCLPDALGRILRGRNAKGQYRNAVSIRRKVMILQAVLGVVLSVLFALCANLFAETVFGTPYSSLITLVLAPALFLRMISAVLTGYFQGEGTELPTAVSVVLRQVILLGFGLLFAKILANYGTKVSDLLGNEAYTSMYGGVGIAIAFDLTELLVLLFLGLIYLGNRRSLLKQGREGMKQTDSFIDIVRILYGTMGLTLLLGLLERLPLWMGTILYRRSVEEVSSFAVDFGLFAGKYLVICGIPALLTVLALIPMYAKVAGCLKKEDQRGAKMLFQSGLHIGCVQSMFFAAFLAVMAEQIAGIFCKTGAEQVTEMLRFGSFLILFVVLGFYFSRLLMVTGRNYPLLGCLGLADVLFIIAVSLWLNLGKQGIQSLIYASLLGCGIFCLTLGFLCCQMLRTGIEWLKILVIPLGAACVTGLVCLLLGKLFTPHLGNLVTTIVALAAATLIYWAILLLFRSFREQELKYIPGGRLIRAAGQMLHIF